GVSGNDQIGLFRYRGLMNGLSRYVFNDFIINGAAIGATSNPDLKWETTLQTNIGLDFTLWRSIDFTANYFIKDTRDLLFQPAVSSLLGSYGPGGSPPVINAGNVSNKGLEIEIGYGTQKQRGVNFRIDYNATFIRNRVTKVPDGLDFIPGAGFSVGGNVATRFQEGFPIGYFIGFQTDGIFQSEEEIASSPVVQAGARPGDLRFVDTNGDGVINFSDDSDRTFIGSPIPDFIMGLNLAMDFKGFDISANVYAAIGQEIIRNYERQQPFANQLAYNVDRWTGPGSTNEIPRLTTGQTRNTVFSDFFVEDGSFIRLRNVQVGYTLPEAITGRIGIRSMRFYVAANNLITLTRYMGFDPDVGSGNPLFAGVDNGIFPQARVIMGGLNFRF
ncbi:TonB-dependent receptor domain-containing protein, partial [Aquiflexum sp.]|uniref:TonB-dependent receptor domain-containing protein n=1 Tax=Aquiflexum sp. TaxID=1872584 RepID=UPI003593FDE5